MRPSRSHHTLWDGKPSSRRRCRVHFKGIISILLLLISLSVGAFFLAGVYGVPPPPSPPSSPSHRTGTQGPEIKSPQDAELVHATSANVLNPPTTVNASPTNGSAHIATRTPRRVHRPVSDTPITIDKLTEDSDPRLGRVHSVAELRQFCHEHAAALETASWTRSRNPSIDAHTAYGTANHGIQMSPVCINQHGQVLIDGSADHMSLVRNGWIRAGFTPGELTDAWFPSIEGRGQHHAVAVPALGVFVPGGFLATHIWHLLLDCAGQLMMTYMHYNHGELLTLPTQTVMFHDQGNVWIDRYGDTAKRTVLSARALNGLSSPHTGGAFFPLTPTVRLAKGKVGIPPPPSSAAPQLAYLPTQCYCQAMPVQTAQLSMDGPIDPAVYHAIADAINTQFDEEDYLHEDTLAEIESRRLASHPWASQFWNESSAFDEKGVYRPRALVVHRQSRLISNYDKYINHLKQLGFRVMEVFPEKYSLDQQYHMGRYADLVVGMHGLGVSHGFWMDRFPLGCRTVVEFRPWVVVDQPIDLYRIMGRHSRFGYHYIIPTDVRFGPSIRDPVTARRRLMRRDLSPIVWTFPEFTDQTAIYNEDQVLLTLTGIRAHLDRCLPLTGTVHRFSPIIDAKSGEDSA